MSDCSIDKNIEARKREKSEKKYDYNDKTNKGKPKHKSWGKYLFFLPLFGISKKFWVKMLFLN